MKLKIGKVDDTFKKHNYKVILHKRASLGCLMINMTLLCRLIKEAELESKMSINNTKLSSFSMFTQNTDKDVFLLSSMIIIKKINNVVRNNHVDWPS